MKAAPLLISWHNDGQPVWSAHFEPNGHGRLATSGGDGNVRLWRVEEDGDARKVTYLSTLIKHNAAVNVVRFAPKGEMLATAGDDGNIILWIPTDHKPTKNFGDDDEVEDKETWRVKHMCRLPNQAEIYDLAWSPDGRFFITGSMDNVAKIFDASTGTMVRQIAEHNHFVQGVAWDPLNEYVATQSSDRSIHIYSLRTKEGEHALKNKVSKIDLPARRISNSPAPPDYAFPPPSLPDHKSIETPTSQAPASPAPTPSVPGTPSSLALPMNPPAYTHSRRSSFGSPSVGRSASPAPSMPLPAVRPMEHSPIPFGGAGLGVRNAPIYANEAMTTFFRRLTFAPDGSLLFTPAGQFKTLRPNPSEGGKPIEDIRNTVYIYTRAGLSKPPVAHLPGHKKPSIAVRCSPVFYKLRTGNTKETVQITLDTSSNEGPISALPASVVPAGAPAKEISPTSNPAATPSAESKTDSELSSSAAGPAPVFALPYRIIYAVATQDTVLVYDTQQQTPLCVATNLHLATFTDLTWSPDGRTLLISSSDGFCSALSFAPEELGDRYTDPVPTHHHPNVVPAQQPAANTGSAALAGTKLPPVALSNVSSHMSAPSPMKSRSNSASSVATQASTQTGQTTLGFKPFNHDIGNNPAPVMSQLPGLVASNPSPTTGSFGLPSGPTPPMTPSERAGGSSFYGSQASVGMKRQASNVSEKTEDGREIKPEGEPVSKKRRVAPILVKQELDLPPPPSKPSH